MSYQGYGSEMYNSAREYGVKIVAKDETDREIRFTEMVNYQAGVTGPVHESEREAQAIQQVEARMPHLRNVRTEGSCHV